MREFFQQKKAAPGFSSGLKPDAAWSAACRVVASEKLLRKTSKILVLIENVLAAEREPKDDSAANAGSKTIEFNNDR